ncbi:MAG: tRNA ((46)-N7)-methyltransferase TrmB [Actinomycetota bacterium]
MSDEKKLEFQANSIRTYKLRASRVTGAQAFAIETQSDKFVIPESDSTINFAQELGLDEFIIEIGFGMGEATAVIAALQPRSALLAIDVHTPGVGALLHRINELNLSHVRIIEGDALLILDARIDDNSVDGVRLFFPDPWPKKRHHKRRFANPENLSTLATKVKSGGFLHIATDWDDYAEQAIEHLTAHPDWTVLPAGTGIGSAQPDQRPRTRFEQKGIDQGRNITDVVAVRN